MAWRGFRLPVALVAIGFGAAVEWLLYDASLGLAATVADFAVGCVLLVCGTIAWERRRESRVGPLMGVAGAAWFLGNVATPLLYLHHGPLVHLELSYPTGRLRSRLVQAVVAAAWLDVAIEPLGRSDPLTLALSGSVALAAVYLFTGTTGPARKAGGPALTAALAFAAALALGAIQRIIGWAADRPVLWAYDLAIAAVAIVLLADLLRGRWAEAVVTGLVVDLGAVADAGLLRAKLARRLGDPSLVVGYRVAGSEGFVDDSGLPVELPAPGLGRTVTPLRDRGEEVAVLVHDEALLADGRLVESVAAAARIAVANVALQAEARAKAVELEASRRRIVETADAQRRRIRDELQLGTGSRLDRVASLLAEARGTVAASDASALASLQGELAELRRELTELAQGMLPGALTDGGLLSALSDLAEQSALPVEIRGAVGRLPEPIEAALFFVCSEALANAAKHAGASRVIAEIRAENGRVVATVHDDGRGGADPISGSGLRGLADRVEALGGRLSVTSPVGGGTRVVAEIPAGDASEGG
jgi:signal transduction histidine kinase